MSEQAFPEEFREVLQRGKYSSWAVGLTWPQLRAVLWAVGELGIRIHPGDSLREMREQLKSSVDHPRVCAAIEAISRIVQRGKVDLDEVHGIVHAFTAEDQAAGE